MEELRRLPLAWMRRWTRMDRKGRWARFPFRSSHGKGRRGGPPHAVGWQQQRLMGPAACGPPYGLAFHFTVENRFIITVSCNLNRRCFGHADTASFPIYSSSSIHHHFRFNHCTTTFAVVVIKKYEL